MKGVHLSEYQAFVRYFDIPGDEEPSYIYLGGLSTSATLSLLDIATHPKIRGNRSLLIDYLGSGFSDVPTGFNHSMGLHAQTVSAVLDAEALNGCTVIGHSMGGVVGAYLGETWPDSPEPKTLTSRGIRVGIVENSGHVMMVDNLDGFADVVAAALADQGE